METATTIALELKPIMIQSILEVLKCADKDRTSAILAAVCLRFTKGHLSIVATDGKILVEHKYEFGTDSIDFGSDEFDLEKNDHLDIMIPASNKDTVTILKLLAKQVKPIALSLVGHSLRFNDMQISCITDGTYPAYEKALDFNPEYTPPKNQDMPCRFGWNAKYMGLIDKALSLDNYSHGVIIYPQGAGKGVIVVPINNTHEAKRIALLMPITIPE